MNLPLEMPVRDRIHINLHRVVPELAGDRFNTIESAESVLNR
jgi:hypothetical protein